MGYTYNNDLNKISNNININNTKVNKTYKYVKIVAKFFELTITKRNKNRVIISVNGTSDKNNVIKKKKKVILTLKITNELVKVIKIV